MLFRGDVRRHLDDPVRLAVRIVNRIVGGLEPDLLAALGQAAVFACHQLSLGELMPERAVLRRGYLGGVAEEAVVLSDDFVERITHQIEEVGVGADDPSL